MQTYDIRSGLAASVLRLLSPSSPFERRNSSWFAPFGDEGRGNVSGTDVGSRAHATVFLASFRGSEALRRSSVGGAQFHELLAALVNLHAEMALDAEEHSPHLRVCLREHSEWLPMNKAAALLREFCLLWSVEALHLDERYFCGVVYLSGSDPLWLDSVVCRRGRPDGAAEVGEERDRQFPPPEVALQQYCRRAAGWGCCPTTAMESDHPSSPSSCAFGLPAGVLKYRVLVVLDSTTLGQSTTQSYATYFPFIVATASPSSNMKEVDATVQAQPAVKQAPLEPLRNGHHDDFAVKMGMLMKRASVVACASVWDHFVTDATVPRDHLAACMVSAWMGICEGSSRSPAAAMTMTVAGRQEATSQRRQLWNISVACAKALMLRWDGESDSNERHYAIRVLNLWPQVAMQMAKDDEMEDGRACCRSPSLSMALSVCQVFLWLSAVQPPSSDGSVSSVTKDEDAEVCRTADGSDADDRLGFKSETSETALRRYASAIFAQGPTGRGRRPPSFLLSQTSPRRSAFVDAAAIEHRFDVAHILQHDVLQKPLLESLRCFLRGLRGDHRAAMQLYRDTVTSPSSTVAGTGFLSTPQAQLILLVVANDTFSSVSQPEFELPVAQQADPKTQIHSQTGADQRLRTAVEDRLRAAARLPSNSPVGCQWIACEWSVIAPEAWCKTAACVLIDRFLVGDDEDVVRCVVHLLSRLTLNEDDASSHELMLKCRPAAIACCRRLLLLRSWKSSRSHRGTRHLTLLLLLVTRFPQQCLAEVMSQLETGVVATAAVAPCQQCHTMTWRFLDALLRYDAGEEVFAASQQHCRKRLVVFLTDAICRLAAMLCMSRRCSAWKYARRVLATLRTDNPTHACSACCACFAKEAQYWQRKWDEDVSSEVVKDILSYRGVHEVLMYTLWSGDGSRVPRLVRRALDCVPNHAGFVVRVQHANHMLAWLRPLRGTKAASLVVPPMVHHCCALRDEVLGGTGPIVMQPFLNEPTAREAFAQFLANLTEFDADDPHAVGLSWSCVALRKLTSIIGFDDEHPLSAAPKWRRCSGVAWHASVLLHLLQQLSVYASSSGGNGSGSRPPSMLATERRNIVAEELHVWMRRLHSLLVVDVDLHVTSDADPMIGTLLALSTKGWIDAALTVPMNDAANCSVLLRELTWWNELGTACCASLVRHEVVHHVAAAFDANPRRFAMECHAGIDAGIEVLAWGSDGCPSCRDAFGRMLSLLLSHSSKLHLLHSVCRIVEACLVAHRMTSAERVVSSVALCWDAFFCPIETEAETPDTATTVITVAESLLHIERFSPSFTSSRALMAVEAFCTNAAEVAVKSLQPTAIPSSDWQRFTEMLMKQCSTLRGRAWAHFSRFLIHEAADVSGFRCHNTFSLALMRMEYDRSRKEGATQEDTAQMELRSRTAASIDDDIGSLLLFGATSWGSPSSPDATSKPEACSRIRIDSYERTCSQRNCSAIAISFDCLPNFVQRTFVVLSHRGGALDADVEEGGVVAEREAETAIEEHETTVVVLPLTAAFVFQHSGAWMSPAVQFVIESLQSSESRSRPSAGWNVKRTVLRASARSATPILSLLWSLMYPPSVAHEGARSHRQKQRLGLDALVAELVSSCPPDDVMIALSHVTTTATAPPAATPAQLLLLATSDPRFHPPPRSVAEQSSDERDPDEEADVQSTSSDSCCHPHQATQEYTIGLFYDIRRRLHALFAASVVIGSGIVASTKQGTMGKVGGLLSAVGGAVPVVGSAVAGVGSALQTVDLMAQTKKLERIRLLAVGDGEATELFSKFAQAAVALVAEDHQQEGDMNILTRAEDSRLDVVSQFISATLHRGLCAVSGAVAIPELGTSACLRHSQVIADWFEAWVCGLPYSLLCEGAPLPRADRYEIGSTATPSAAASDEGGVTEGQPWTAPASSSVSVSRRRLRHARLVSSFQTFIGEKLAELRHSLEHVDDDEAHAEDSASDLGQFDDAVVAHLQIVDHHNSATSRGSVAGASTLKDSRKASNEVQHRRAAVPVSDGACCCLQ